MTSRLIVQPVLTRPNYDSAHLGSLHIMSNAVDLSAAPSGSSSKQKAATSASAPSSSSYLSASLRARRRLSVRQSRGETEVCSLPSLSGDS